LKAWASAEVIALSSSAHSSPVPACVPSPSIVTLEVTKIFPVTISALRLVRVMLFIVTVS
jgi:hypothetical protein